MQLKYTRWHDILISQDVYWTKSPKLSYITQAKAISIFMQQSLKVYVVSFFSGTTMWTHLVIQGTDNSKVKSNICYRVC